MSRFARTAGPLGASAIMLLAVVLSGCAQETKPVGSPVESAWESAAAAPAVSKPMPVANVEQMPATGPADSVAGSQPAGVVQDIPVAVVNGEIIGKTQLTDMLMESRGLAVLEQLILLTAARQKAASMSITVTPTDLAAAENEALQRIAAPVGNPDGLPLDRVATERLLTDFLRLKGLSRAEWKCRMEQRAYLTRIAQAEAAKVEITEAMLRDEYNLSYGERVQIRHIQASTPEAISHAAEMLKTKPFEEVSRQLSENSLTREQGGLMPPFTRHDAAVPPFIRERAFAMKVGDVSEPLREGAYYHIIRVDRKFPASSVGFENVDRDTLRKSLLERIVRQRTDALDAELFQAARIDIRDRNLARQFRERHQ